MQLPLWFSLWQSLDSLLAIALNAAEAFPFLLSLSFPVPFTQSALSG